MVRTPLIPKGHFYVLIADTSTGHILNLNGSVCLANQNNEIIYFLSAESLNDITQKALELLEQREGIEALVYDSDSKFIKILNKSPL